MDVTAMIDSDIAYASDTPAHVTLQPGGVAANTAAWMATAGHQVTIAGAVGDDPFGLAIRDELAAIGVDVQLAIAEGLATGTCVVIVDRRRERTMFPDSGANAAVSLDRVRSLITADTHVHLSGYTLLNPATSELGRAVLDHAVQVGATRSLDPASAAPLRSRIDQFSELLPLFQLVLANEDEAAVLSGREDPHDALMQLAEIVPTAVVKIGARGVLARDSTGSVAQPAHSMEVIDTTGAGDAFTAGFLPVWLAGGPLATAVSEGQLLAARAVGRVGASPLVR